MNKSAIDWSDVATPRSHGVYNKYKHYLQEQIRKAASMLN